MLTDERIEQIYTEQTGSFIDDAPWALQDFSRAIEAEATAPLLERIAELERKSDQDSETILWQAGQISKHLDCIAELKRKWAL
jgi:hypothetical protein